jgi:hypothetical protein
MNIDSMTQYFFLDDEEDGFLLPLSMSFLVYLVHGTVFFPL